MSDVTQFSIRLATSDDYEQLCELWEVLDEYHRLALPQIFRRPNGPRRERAVVQSIIDGPGSTLFVAEAANKELLGFATVFVRSTRELPVRAEREFVEIDNMAVKPAARRKGIARSIVEASAAWGKERGLTSLELFVYDFNEVARSFYRAMGFSDVIHRMGRKIEA